MLPYKYNLLPDRYYTNVVDQGHRMAYVIRAGDDFIFEAPISYPEPNISQLRIVNRVAEIDEKLGSFLTVEKMQDWLKTLKTGFKYPQSFLELSDFFNSPENCTKAAVLMFVEYLLDQMLQTKSHYVFLIRI
ncbi:hypothetical protein RCL1_003477 [Eukaryota sp. TZLM3-RCL]